MSAANNIHPLLARLLPERIEPLAQPDNNRRSGHPSVGLYCPLGFIAANQATISRVESEADTQALYATLRRLTLRGNVSALNDLGWAWLNGKYWRPSPSLANRLLRMAAVQGHAGAWFNLGQQHYFGKGLDMSYVQAAVCYRHAFECGMAQAAAALGDLYEEEVCDGEPVWQVDLDEAYRWFLAGARAGDPRCRFEAGVRLLHGVNTPVDSHAAVAWLVMAAGAGVVQAAEVLAEHFSTHDAGNYQRWRQRAIALGSRLSADDRRRRPYLG